MSLSLYFHTIRHLRPVQIWGRVRFRLSRPAPDLSPAPPLRAPKPGAWRAAAPRPQTQLGAARFRFLNVERELAAPGDWNDASSDKLWLYNLHYFDDLNSDRASERTPWHDALIRRWIDENPPGAGNGWEPYTLSLRIVNWIKRALGGIPLDSAALHSLAVQTRYLAARLEYHLQGNHLLANAKALVFAGAFFAGPQADKWLTTGLRILEEGYEEQILPDGAHFERSPMYHNIILEDVLDLVNLIDTCPDVEARAGAQLTARWRARAADMLDCARALTHPDGDIALLNDSALGIAVPLAKLEEYAARIGIRSPGRRDEVAHLEAAGYVRLQNADAWALLDVGPIGPDYLPGHAHADTLTFELSVGGRRAIVDSGTSTYAAGPERLRQRSTGAHNTVEIDGFDSSEVWGSFRVARRAYPFGLELMRRNDMICVRCSHDGYARLKGRPLHRREWTLHRDGMVVHDTIEGTFDSAVARFRFHPECTLIRCDDKTGEIAVGPDYTLRWSIETGTGRIVDSSYHPEFGMSVACKCLEIDVTGHDARTRFTWAASR